MKIIICNSTKFHALASKTKEELEKLGHKALMHPLECEFRGKKSHVIEQYNARQNHWDEELADLKEFFMREHFEKIKDSDAVLILNVDKDEKKNYVGGNTFLEMGLAFALNKKIFMLNPIPEEMPYAEEIKGMRPIVIYGDLSKVK
jgi:nucleoside 2-deoxyribosyltransferase